MDEMIARRQGTGGSHANHRVLIVDDDRDFADALGASLEMHGYGVAIAGDADEAIEVAGRYGPEASLLDLRLGPSCGLDLVPVLRQRFPEMMCLILTGYGDLDSAIGAIRHQADDYLRKPMPPEEIARVLDRCFEKRERERVEQTPGTVGGAADDRSAATAEKLAKFVTFLRLQAERKGGKLTSGDLEALGRQFHGKVKAPAREPAPAPAESVQPAQAKKEPTSEHPREDLFGRLMVERFAEMFDGKGKHAAKGSRVSRHILPGFFVALSMMLGSEKLEEYQKRCRRIVDRLQEAHPDGMEWEVFYADDEAKVLALDAEIAMVLHFGDLERRIAWFIDVVNGHAEPAPAGSAGHRLSKVACQHLLGALFSDVTEALSRQEGRTAITEHYGVEKCVVLAEIAAQIMRTVGRG